MKRNHFLVLVGLALFVLFGYWLGHATRPENFQLQGKLTFDPTQVPSADYDTGDYIVRWRTENGGQLTVEAKDRPGIVLWQTIPGEAFVMAAQANETVTENRGMFQFQDRWQVVCSDQTVDSFQQSEYGLIQIKGLLDCSDNSTFTYDVYFGKAPSSNAGITVDINNKSNRVFLTYASSPNEHFFGFGEQFTYFDMKGKKVPIWVSEQGVGRGEQPLTFFADLTNGGAGGSAFTSYAPMPFYLTNKMRGISQLSCDSNHACYSVFDLRKPDRVQIEVWSSELQMNIMNGSSPQEIIHQNLFAPVYGTTLPVLPEWVFSKAIVGMQGGTDKVHKTYAKLKERNTPITAFWLQDWVGQRVTSFGKQLWWNWEVDYDRYPGWEQLVSELNKDGVNVMVYISPYLADIGNLKPNVRRNLFQEAKEKGYLVKNSVGEPYLVQNTDFYFGMVNLFDSNARHWYKNVIEEQVIGVGAKGWMADFGEGLPFDTAVGFYTGAEFHNDYPLFWAMLNREIVYETDKDIVFFNRAASTNSPNYATLFWEGDQLVDWSAEDGIKSAVTGLNTSGLSGMAFNHSDIGGYTTITNPILNIHRSRELLYRWMEMNAFTLIFRTHEGNQPDKNVQFYTDDETLDTFAYWAKVYAALFDYRKQLVQEATETGLPVVRHPFIHYPDDPETWKITYQEFMLGRDFLIAPVTDPETTQVTAYLPKGRWVHIWTGTVYDGGQYITIDAPLGQPAVFYVEGSQAGQDFVNTLQSQGLMP